jgi:plastocyanin
VRLGKSWTSRGALAAVALLVMTGLVACGSDSKSSTSATTTPATSTPATGAAGATGATSLRAGLNDPTDNNIAILQYLPQSVTVTAGSTVEWRIAGPEPHTITFLPPGQTPPTPDKADPLFVPTPAVNGTYDGKSLVNSGLLPQGPGAVPPFRLKFPTAGKFTFQCVIHPQMTGTVNVVDANGKADTQADVDSRGTTELNQWLAEGRAAKQKLMSTAPASTKNADGTTTWKVEMGASTAHTDVLAFAPPSPDVKVGDTVTFVNNSGAPHTASFAGKGTLPQSPVEPAAQRPAPGPSPQTLNPTDVFNTGILPPNAPPGGGPPEAVRSYSYVLKTAGSFTYVCIFHAPSGMAGSIKVA